MTDERFMRDALATAARVEGCTGDNPWVGCVIFTAAHTSDFDVDTCSAMYPQITLPRYMPPAKIIW